MSRGAPLAMMGLVLAAWIGGRAMVWESPFPVPADLIPTGFPAIAAADLGAAPATLAVPNATGSAVPVRRAAQHRGDGSFAMLASGLTVAMEPEYAFAHQYLLRAAYRSPLDGRRMAAEFLVGDEGDVPPFFAAPEARPAAGRKAGHWLADAWGFWRQGSDAAPIAQGRAPIYGASQIGALLQYRIRPENQRDPRLYVRAYRALVRRGESELALGASARPLPRVPVRLFGELRITDGAFRTEARPAAYAVTELAPQGLPFGARLEGYAQAGWVGGEDATLFADGQASLTRAFDHVAQATGDAMRFSLGAGVWSGAQDGAHRVDLGPTMRLDVRLGEVPARLSLDWRERVEGDAAPGSGAAVTLSTRF
ncbi:MAG: hypothetical protein ACK4IC_04390 [Erythrobacter sp.]